MNPKRVLVIDDEEAVLFLFQQSLESTGAVVDTARSGKEGIEKMKTATYHVVFLDLNMPGLSGVETLRAIRKIDEAVPVYIVTGFYDRYFSELNTVAGEDKADFEILQKPVDSRLLQDLVSGTPVDVSHLARKDD